jgi:hypothetical protein
MKYSYTLLTLVINETKWSETYNDYLHNLYSSQGVIRGSDEGE